VVASARRNVASSCAIPFDSTPATPSLVKQIPLWKTEAKERTKCFQWTPRNGRWQTVNIVRPPGASIEQHTLVILGSGYTGRFLVPLALRQYQHVYNTSREPERKLGHLPANQRLHFDLTRPDTWKNIPSFADLLWCFPAMPLELVQQFAANVFTSPRRIVVLGSTSAYTVGDSQQYPPPWIDETAPIDLSKPRVQGEEFLRTYCHAIVLRVAGIYGPARNPIDWIRSGRVGPSRKYVNLIHVEDLASICLTALDRGQPGEIYNVSDGTPRTWTDIFNRFQQRWKLLRPIPESTDTPGKRMSNVKLRLMLDTAGISICHSDFYQSIEQIQDAAPIP